MVVMAEYIWLDGARPTQELRSKTKVIEHNELCLLETEYPEWSFDGSSTNQSSGGCSDLTLKPVRVVKDPIRGGDNTLVYCEVFNSDGIPHESNTRARLRQVLDAGGSKYDPWVGFEQEYTLFSGHNPLGWPDDGYPRPQGPFYCGVGADKVYGRQVVEKHLELCVQADLLVYGINAEVMPGQWEYQVGYRGFKEDKLDALTLCDHQYLARWLLCRVAEDYHVSVCFDNKPVKGDWNGAGCHTNFSTSAMRTPGEGLAAIKAAVALLEKNHQNHIRIYGHDLESRLTGEHETCSINEFRAGVADRAASIRIPAQVEENGFGYLEDRRPGANSEPYLVTACLITTICGLDKSLMEVRHDAQLKPSILDKTKKLVENAL